jgi:hypothetical protein
MVEEIRKSWRDNKFLLSVFGVMIAGLMAWGIWVTKGVFGATFNQEKIVSICADIAEVQRETAGLKTKIDVQGMKMDVQILKSESNQVEILRNQADIMKELKRK